ncbi:MAG: hypothetical protein R3B89_06725 [Polyangiaceae bacterium]
MGALVSTARDRSTLLGWALLAICSTLPSTAGAQSAARLSVLREGDALSCPGHAELVSRVEVLLERPFSAATSDPVELLVHFRRTPAGLQAEVRMTGQRSGVRRIRTDAQPGTQGECDELGAAAALAISMLLDPTFLGAEEVPDSPYETSSGDDLPTSPDPGAPPDLAPRLIPPPLPAAAPSPVSADPGGRRLPLVTPDWSLGLGPAESDGLLGGQSFGLQLQLGIFLGDNARVGLLGRRFATATHRLGEGEVDVDLWQLGAEGCYYGGKRPLQLGACGALLGGAIRGEAFGFQQVSAATHAWFGAEAGVAALWSFAPGWWVGGDLRLVVPFNRDEFLVRGVGQLTPGNDVAQTAQISLGFRIE